MKRDKDGKFYATRQELRLAKALGGRRQAASGALWGAGAKADIRAFGSIRQEAKWTADDHYSLKVSEFKKLWKVATAAGEVATFLIEFRNDQISVVLSDIEPAGEFGIREVSECSNRSYRIKVDDVKRLQREAFRASTSYLWEIQFSDLTLYAFSFETLLGDCY